MQTMTTVNQPIADDKPLVSIIVSCYNHEAYIEDCVLSILKQTYNNVELIVIDDGSSDNSATILEQLQKEHHFYFERQANQGLTKTLNKAIKLAKGKYIAPLGSDDIILPNKTAIQVNYLEQRPDIAVIGGNILCIDEQGNVKPKQRHKGYREVDFKTIFKQPKLIPAAPSVMIRASVLEEINGYNTECQLEDLYLWLKITQAGYPIAVLAEVVAHYREHASNTYKDYRFMTESLLQTYRYFSTEPGYEYIKYKTLITMFLKTSKKDTAYALSLLKKIPFKYYNMKVLRGIFHLSLPDKKK